MAQAQNRTAVRPKKRFHHGDLREALIAAMRELLIEHGPDGFTLADACRRAGVTTAAPYKHFRDKQEILRKSCCAASRSSRPPLPRRWPRVGRARLRASPPWVLPISTSPWPSRRYSASCSGTS